MKCEFQLKPSTRIFKDELNENEQEEHILFLCSFHNYRISALLVPCLYESGSTLLLFRDSLFATYFFVVLAWYNIIAKFSTNFKVKYQNQLQSIFVLFVLLNEFSVFVRKRHEISTWILFPSCL